MFNSFGFGETDLAYLLGSTDILGQMLLVLGREIKMRVDMKGRLEETQIGRMLIAS